jgi:tryptophanyl-tRNA synthetase
VQSDVPEIAELYLYLNMLAYKGELEKTTSFKDKVRMQPENVNAGLLTYPVLQAADILIHRAVKVPVGKDQEQNLEMARNFAERFNYRYGEIFPLPYAFNYNSELVKILGLDGNGKMSKSENQNTTLFLADEDEAIRNKIKKAKTDQGPLTPNAIKPDYIENLFTLMKLVSTTDTVQKFEDDFNNSTEGNCIIRYGDMKKQLAEDMVKFIQPIRNQALDLQNNKDLLTKIIRQGADKARASATDTLSTVRKAVGMDY